MILYLGTRKLCKKYMQEYRSGHNEAVLKTVWVKAHVGSNPTPSAKRKRTPPGVLFLLNGEKRDLNDQMQHAGGVLLAG